MARWLLALGLSLWVPSAGPATAQEDSPLRKRFFAEAPQAWKRHEAFWATLEGTSKGKRRERRDGNWTTSLTRQFWKQCNGNDLHSLESLESGVWRGSIWGENSEYSFELVRDGENKPWVIRDVKRKVEQPPEATHKRNPGGLAISGGPSLAVIFDSPGFKCVDVVPEPRNGEELVRLTFSYTPENKEPTGFRDSWVLLDPSRYWLIREAGLDMVYGAQEWRHHVTIHNDYKEGSNHHPILARFAMTSKMAANPASEVEITAEYDLHERPSIPESEFTLSAYGLPEPSWVRPKGTPWYLWLGAAGILCLILGAGVGWLKWRRAARVG